ncbi:hypothetical protein ALQ05_02703 [Pseudomonas amygdali pv. mori]|uniref:Uncharacterized protein n=1 Tax=Pseudomonas amygdali pv. mori TaxID=34065 RepID=A0A3M4LEK8_PSEA0|nr:hypothetical protein ALQ05_02703 [Pseudomonas amygdali pv. mori]RMT17062.1 hypothetical protein ALP52_01599 [Pseudomonas amygdali pv. mori]
MVFNACIGLFASKLAPTMVRTHDLVGVTGVAIRIAREGVGHKKARWRFSRQRAFVWL